jgi:hypothetical protein
MAYKTVRSYVPIVLLHAIYSTRSPSPLASIYRVPLKGAAAMARDLREAATKLSPLLKDVNLKHPLVRVTKWAILVV